MTGVELLFWPLASIATLLLAREADNQTGKVILTVVAIFFIAVSFFVAPWSELL